MFEVRQQNNGAKQRILAVMAPKFATLRQIARSKRRSCFAAIFIIKLTVAIQQYALNNFCLRTQAAVDFKLQFTPEGGRVCYARAGLTAPKVPGISGAGGQLFVAGPKNQLWLDTKPAALADPVGR